jgi:Ca-activated chloride channel homolog
MILGMTFLGLEWRFPAALALVPLLPGAFALGAFLRVRRGHRLARLGLHVPRSSAATSGMRSWTWVNSCWFMALTLLALGAAGPVWGQKKTAPLASEHDLVLLVDMSRSMLASDVLPNRCGRASQAIGALCMHLEKRGGARLALVAFATEGRLLCPLTQDYAHVRQIAMSLDPALPPSGLRPTEPGAVSGTRLGVGLQAAVAAADSGDGKFADILLLSDGDDPAEDQEWRVGAQAAREARIPVHAVGLGDPQRPWDLELPVRRAGKLTTQRVSTALQEAPLRDIAQITGGLYIPARTDPLDLPRLYEDVIEPLPRHASSTEGTPEAPVQSAWFFAIGLGCLLLALLPPGVIRIRSPASDKPRTGFGPALALTAVAVASMAASPHRQAWSLLRAAYAAFRSGHYVQAQDDFGRAKALAEDPGFAALGEATALVRQGDFDQALACADQCLEDASGERRSKALFLRGIALFHTALSDTKVLRRAAYDFSLVLTLPETDAELAAAARHNLELTRLLLASLGVSPEDNSNQGSGADKGRDEEGGEGSRNGSRALPKHQGEHRGLGSGQDLQNAESAMNPGRGNLPLTLTDSGSPLSRSAAASLLEEAEKRIEAGLLELRRSRVLDANAPSKDW